MTGLIETKIIVPHGSASSVQRALALLVLASLCMSIPRAAEALDLPAAPGDPLALSYDIYWHGLKIIELDSRVEVDAREFQHWSRFETAGILRLFVKGETESQASGRFLGFDRRLAARRFETVGRWSDKDYARRLSFALNGRVRDVEIDMPDEWMDREPVPVSMQRGPDPLSLITWAMTDPWGVLDGRDDSEVGPLTSFDGIRAMEYRLSCEAAPRNVKRSAPMSYAGEVRICSLAGRQTAGFWRGDDDGDKTRKRRRAGKADKEESEYGDQRLEFWLAEAPGRGLFVPVRVDIRSRRGEVRAYLKEVSTPLQAPGSAQPAGTTSGE